jgi:hypothetical protein
VSRTRHHVPGQARQTPASDTDALDTIASMHEPRSAIVAEVASHYFACCRRTSVLAQALRIRCFDRECWKYRRHPERGARLPSADCAVADVDYYRFGQWADELSLL